MIYMLDTNTSIYAMAPDRSDVRERASSFRGQVCMSTISYAELVFGVHRSQRVARNLEALAEFVSLVPVVEFSAEAAAASGELRAHLQSKGTPIGLFDVLIAAHARSLDLTVVTNNRREFDRVPGLKVENWAA